MEDTKEMGIVKTIPTHILKKYDDIGISIEYQYMVPASTFGANVGVRFFCSLISTVIQSLFHVTWVSNCVKHGSGCCVSAVVE